MLQQITRILWPVITGILIALLVIREFPELTGRTRGVELNIVESSTIASQIPSEGPVSYATAVERAAPAVVNIYTTTIVETRAHPLARDPFFRNFFNLPSEPRRKRMESSLGSGVIVSGNGYILTNHHVIAGADDIVVELKDGRVAQASVVGTDPDTDIAVLKIELNNLPKLILTTSPGRVGDLVFAIGNPFGVGQTVTMGILSATGRNQVGVTNYENFIQTDAAINPGNSGGALINIRGELIGINTAIFTRSGGSNGIGFAIPASIATDIMQELINHGQVIRGWIGVETQPLTEDLARSFGVSKNAGVLISGVYRRGPAANADILPGDILTHMNGQKITDGRAAMNQVADFEPGTKIPVQLLRNGQTIERVILVGQRPNSAAN